MIVICIYHGGVVKPFDCSHFALSSCDGAHSDTCAFLHKEIGPMARSVNKSASLLCFFLGGLLWRGYNIRNLLRRSFRYQAFRLAPAPGERKTRFEESELHAWQWLMQWSDRPPLEQVPAQFRELVQKAGPVSWLDSLVGSFVVVGWFVRGGLVRSWWVADGVRVPRFGHVPSAARCVGWFVLGWFVRGGWRTGCVCRALATSRLLLGVLVGSCWVGSFVVGWFVRRGLRTGCVCRALATSRLLLGWFVSWWVRSFVSQAAGGVRVPRFGHVPSAARLVRCGLVRSSRAAGGVRVPRFGHVPSAARCVGWFVLWLNSVCVRRCNCRLSHLWSKTSLLCSQFLGRRIRQQPCNHWASELVSFSWWFLSVSGFGTAAGATCEARPASCAASSWAAGSDSSRVTS